MRDAHIVEDLGIDGYHASSGWVSKSRLGDFAKRGPRYYYRRWVTRDIRFDDSDALRLGRAFDVYFEDEGSFPSHYAVRPPGLKFSTKEGKAWRAETEAGGFEILSQDEMAMVRSMKRNTLENETARLLLEGCSAQKTLRATWSDHFGIQSRIDFTNFEGNAASGGAPYFLDLKSSRGLNGFDRDIHNFKYDAQMAMGRMIAEGLGIEGMRYFLLVSEKEGGRRAQVLELTESFVDIGEAWVREHLSKLQFHYEQDSWPVTGEEYRLVEPPKWLAYQYNQQQG